MVIEANNSTTINLDGKEYIYFGGTNYLGMAHRSELWSAATAAFERYGFSAGASRLTSGESDLLIELEHDLAHFAKEEDSIVLPAGFMTNRAVVDAINDEVDYWIISKYAHGSIKSALAHTGKVLMVDAFLPAEATGDRRSLRGRLGLPECRLGFFAEPIDPLLGWLQDIRALSHLVGDTDFLVLDEAHSFGVLGEHGRGALEHFNIPASNPRIIRTGTFSKALGSQGGFILASKQTAKLLKANSNSYKVSTPLSPVACAASLAGLRLLRDQPDSTIRQLRKNLGTVNEGLVEIGFGEFANNPVPIYHLPDSPKIAALREYLPKAGMYLPTVTSYFADFCEIGLRWTIQSGHSAQHLNQLLEAIAKFSA